ncbi:MAG: HAMP domain-containing histidine kinase [Clostridia bacterium]|nr:HAMP domain-containing histidine kinase [Clostridia bacterium]
MFKGIYFKLVSTYLTLFLVIILLISFFTLSIFYREFTNQAQQDLISAGEKTNALMTRYYDNEISKTELTAWINAMSYISNIKIYILNPDTSILHQVSSEDNMSFNNQIREDIKAVMEGQTVRRMNPFKLSKDTEVVYVGMPLTYNDTISGVIMLFSPITELNSILHQALITIATVILISVLICTLAILRISIKISEPIHTISDYARKIGKGEEVPDVEINSNDELGMLAQSFNEMKKEISVAEQMRREIVANVSHELRTPLTSIIGFIKGILDGVITDDDEKKYLSIAYEEANRLKELTKDIVDVAKLESGSTKLYREEFMLNDLAKDVYVELEELVKEKNLEFIFEEKDQEIMLYADKARIRQVLINIINNSIKFTNEGYIEMTIEKYEDKAKIEIKDTGIGIQQDKIAYLFNKFYTANEYGNATSGAGLGLNIVKNIIDMHEGKITIDSVVNEGTTISIIL